ncbi:MAG TPA: hypothetical protein VHY18_10770 [Solirubrobacteraceae bacterium]|jgi:hypothetical protein|nr:hypothetical protein [Solirubrobacteraceae bacterium]
MAGAATAQAPKQPCADQPELGWEVTMLTILLIVIAVLLLSGFGFGRRRSRRGS